MAEEPKGGILRLLKRTARTASSTVTGKSASDENALWATHEAALGGAREAAQATQRMAGELARQRTALDGATDHGRTALLRLQDASTVVARVRETFERLGLVALNAGLEGARFGEPVGQALRLVADDVRSNASRGTDALRDVDTLLGEVSGELGVLQGSLDRGRTVAIALGDDAQAGGAAAQLAETRLEELGERLRKVTGNDPDTVRAIADVGEHARALVTALGGLSGRVPQALLVSALRPALEPLARLLEDADKSEPGGDEGT
jgi:methyl-accepting chemotaxis protein